MKGFKRKLVKGLSAFLLAGALFFPRESKGQERVIIDPFPNPNSTELAIEHNYQELNPLEKIVYLEKQLKEDTSRVYLRGIPGAMCGNYTGQMWINFNGDSTLVPEEIPFDYYYTENGKQNIQTFDVGFGVVGNPAHSTSGFVINDTLTNISSFYVYDNSRGKRIYLDSLEKNTVNYEIDTSKSIHIEHISGFNTAGFPETQDMLRFEYINGTPILLYKDPTVVLTNPELDKEKPITEYSFTDTITNNSEELVLNYNFHDGEYLETTSWVFYNSLLNKFDTAYYDFYSGHFLDLGFYQIDAQDKIDFNFSQNKVPTNLNSTLLPIYNQSGEIPLDKSEGNHQVVVSVTDYDSDIGNTALDTIKYVIDKTPTTTFDNIPETWQKSDFDVTLTPSDALSGVASTKYCISSKDEGIPDIEYTSPVSISEEGEKYFRYFSTDSAGNNQEIVSRAVKLDKTIPEINIASPESKKYVNEVNNFVFKITDSNLDSCFYSVDKGNTKTYFPCTSGLESTLNLVSNEGLNNWALYAKDKAGNKLEQEVAFEFIPDAVEENHLEKSFKAYPNPTTGLVTFEVYLDAPEGLRFELYNTTGQRLEEKIIEGNPGQNKIQDNFSEYSSGLLIYRIIGDKGYVKTGKVVKR